jgi:hypothetical protein
VDAVAGSVSRCGAAMTCVQNRGFVWERLLEKESMYFVVTTWACGEARAWRQSGEAQLGIR